MRNRLLDRLMTYFTCTMAGAGALLLWVGGVPWMAALLLLLAIASCELMLTGDDA